MENIAVIYICMNMDGVDVIYWINLKRSKERKKHMEKVLRDPAFDSVEKIHFSAVDEKNSMKRFTLPVESVLSVNHRVDAKEYACLASHLDVIRLFSKSKFETAIILEDDVSLEMKPYWKTIKQVMEKAPQNWEILKLQHNRPDQKEIYSKLTYPCYDMKFNTNNPCRWSSAAYLIHKRAALKMMRMWDGKTYHLPPNTFHVADYVLYQVLTTYSYKTPYFLIRKDNDSSIRSSHLYRTRSNRIRRAFLTQAKTRRVY